MSLLRTFIAVDIPSPIQQKIKHQLEVLQHEPSATLIRWVAVENIHLTLKFLGDVSPTNVDALTQILRAEAELVPAFDLRIGGFGSFPSLRRARVLFIGIQAPAELEALNRGIESACVRLGYEAEVRAFHPHLTIGRIKQDISGVDRQKISRILEGLTIDSLGTARVDLVHLYKSELKPSGAVYTKIFSAPLQNSTR